MRGVVGRAVWRQAVAGVRNREAVVLLVVLLVVAGSWGFIELADEVLEGETGAFDRWTLRVLRSDTDPSQPIGPAWLQEASRDITALGSATVLTLFIFAAAGFLLISGAVRMLPLLLAATFGGIALSMGLKAVFARPRPDVVPHLAEVVTASFPSGHAMMSAAVYLTLGTLVASILRSRLLQAYVLVVAVGLTALIGATRIYLGVHYPTDVLAGWTAGAVWALACWLLTHWLQVHGRVERAAGLHDLPA